MGNELGKYTVMRYDGVNGRFKHIRSFHSTFTIQKKKMIILIQINMMKNLFQTTQVL